MNNHEKNVNRTLAFEMAIIHLERRKITKSNAKIFLILHISIIIALKVFALRPFFLFTIFIKKFSSRIMVYIALKPLLYNSLLAFLLSPNK